MAAAAPPDVSREGGGQAAGAPGAPEGAGGSGDHAATSAAAAAAQAAAATTNQSSAAVACGYTPPGGMPTHCAPSMAPGQFPQGFPGYDPSQFAQYGQFPGFPGYGGYGAMYPGMYPMYGAYGLYPQSGYYPQAFAGAPMSQPGAGGVGCGGAMTACGAGGCGNSCGTMACGPTAGSDVRDGGAPHKNMMPGDWICPRCGDHVFARNPACRRCATPKPEGAGLATGDGSFMGGCGTGGGLGLGGGGGGANQRVLPGDWYCPKCKDLQFARNKQCRMCGCQKPETGGFDLRDERAPPSRRSRSRSHRSRSRRHRSRSRE